MGFFSKKDKSKNNNVVATPAPTTGPVPPQPVAPASAPTAPMGAPRPPMAPGATPTPAPTAPMGAPRPPMAPGAAPTPTPAPMGAPRPPMAPGAAPTPAPTFGAPKPVETTPTPTFANPSQPSFNAPIPAGSMQRTPTTGTDQYAQSGLRPTNLGGGNRATVYEMNIDAISAILDIDLEAGRVHKENFGANPDITAVKSYINRLSIRKQELLAIEAQLKARKQELESKLPKKKSTTAKKKPTSKSGTTTSVKTTDVKKPTKKAEPAKKPEIPKDQKHKVITLKDFDDYNYDKRRSDWHKLAGYNEKQEKCSICKEQDNWTSVKLDNGNHICYFCWIKKPTEASRKAVQSTSASKAPAKVTNAPVVTKKEPKKVVKNAKYHSTGAGKELYEYAKSAETRTQLKPTKVGSKPAVKKSTPAKKVTSKKPAAKKKTKK